jgi:hypothetical protein
VVLAHTLWYFAPSKYVRVNSLLIFHSAAVVFHMANSAATSHPASLALEAYATQRQRLPAHGKHVMAHQPSSDTLVVYQAYKPSIAVPAAKHQCFTTDNPDFNPTRMTWIKPGFLWMMYRSGWASKKHQEHILAIHVRKEWFMGILASRATLSSHPTPQTSTHKGKPQQTVPTSSTQQTPSQHEQQQSLSSHSSQQASSPSLSNNEQQAGTSTSPPS